MYRRGRWTAYAAELTEQQEWRIRDGDWHVDVSLGSDVFYDDAQRIVLAIRRQALVNRLPLSIGALKLDTSMPVIEADDVESISRSSQSPDTFNVRVGHLFGLTLTTRILGEAVELHAVGTFQARVIRSDDIWWRTVRVSCSPISAIG